eukprot:7518376-Pyramimonas_sp.AAC.1
MTTFWHWCLSVRSLETSTWSNVVGRAALGPPGLPVDRGEDRRLVVWDPQYAYQSWASQRYRLRGGRRLLQEIFDEWAVEVTMARKRMVP